MKILICGIGGPTPRSIARQIKIVFPEAKIIGVDANPKALGFFMSGLIDQHYIIPKARQKDEYWAKILEIIDKEVPTLAFVQPEAEVLAWNEYKEEKGNFPCPVIIPPSSHAKALVDKVNMSDMLEKTDYIPKTISISPQNPRYDSVQNEIGYPCWIRASVGSGGLGSLKLHRKEELEAWLFIHADVPRFTVSEFLPGRHLANQMLYFNGNLIKNAGLHCVEYVMADIAPSKVTGNTSFGRLINDERLLSFCEEVMDFVSSKTGELPHGVYSFDLKEDIDGKLKVTEVNVRHMAYTGIMAQCGFDLVGDTIKLLIGKADEVTTGRHYFDKNYIFLRDVDIEPIILTEELLESVNFK